ncbi:MAG: helicase-related protein [Bdellovibrionota bacterium]|nr:MAG: helicase-related protein [Bdellovibrionota bacterium]
MLLRDFPIGRIASVLARDNLLPAIVFRTARKQCDQDVQRLQSGKLGLLGSQEKTRLNDELQRVIDKYSLDPLLVREHPHYTALVEHGVGAHHAGQLLVWRLILEELMSRGVLRIMIATGTVAAGVDFPARTVVITAHSRRGSSGFATLTAAELQQMAGRAGRRGKDTVGLCIVAPTQFLDARVIHEVSQQPPEPLRSAYFAAPSTVLNLLKFRNVDDLTYTVQRSLASFLDMKHARGLRMEAAGQEEALTATLDRMGDEGLKKARKRIRRIERQADEIERRQLVELEQSLRGLESLGYVERGRLTAKGLWSAELYTSLVLELAEGVDGGLFDNLSTEEIVGVVASISGDPHRGYLKMRPNPLDKEVYKIMEEIVLKVRAAYVNPATTEVQVLPDAAGTVIQWMRSGNWREFAGILRLSGVAEGDVARLVTQTADHLNQLSRLERTHPGIAKRAVEGREQILRPPLIEAELFEDELATEPPVL